jgi:hypothetical protein
MACWDLFARPSVIAKVPVYKPRPSTLSGAFLVGKDSETIFVQLHAARMKRSAYVRPKPQCLGCPPGRPGHFVNHQSPPAKELGMFFAPTSEGIALRSISFRTALVSFRDRRGGVNPANCLVACDDRTAVPELVIYAELDRVDLLVDVR